MQGANPCPVITDDISSRRTIKIMMYKHGTKRDY